MIDKWVILNLPVREDRRFISVASALRHGVPIEKIRFWHGYEIDDFGSFERAIEAARENMPDLIEDWSKLLDEKKVPLKEHSKFLMLWNVARYLRNLSGRQGDIEMFAHDGLRLTREFRPSFQWFEDVISEITDYDPNFKLLTFGLHNSWYSQLKKINPITPSSFISRGILSWDNFGRVYSSRGAEWTLDRIKTQGSWSVRCNSVLVRRGREKDDWDEGCYSTILPLGADYPSAWLGSNSFPAIYPMRDEFARIFGVDVSDDAKKNPAEKRYRSYR